MAFRGQKFLRPFGRFRRGGGEHDSGNLMAELNGTYNLAPHLLTTMYLNAADADRAHSIGNDYYEWFLTYIENRFASFPEDLKMLGLQRSTQGAEVLRKLDLSDFREILIQIFQFVGREHFASVTHIITALLEEDGLLFPVGEHTELLRQFIFACFGIVTLLFKPLMPPKANVLAIDSPRYDLTWGHASETWTRLEQPLSDCTAPLTDVICKFGNFQGPIPWFSAPATQVPELQTIVSCELNFYHLYRLGGITIRWVDSMCQHLEFNRREKSLMVFRHPSYCAMLSYGQEDGIFLDQFFSDYFEGRKTGSEEFSASQFLREILMTYRLIFGHDKRSWRLCRSLGRKERQPNYLQRLWRSIMWRSAADTIDKIWTEDPLLKRLCCYDCNNESLYDQLYFPDVRTLYSAPQDFPFFGQRLLILQEYTKMLRPYDIWTLWYDRRDLNRFYTIWALIVFSIITLIIALASLALSAAQVAAAFKPPLASSTTT